MVEPVNDLIMEDTNARVDKVFQDISVKTEAGYISFICSEQAQIREIPA